MTAATEGIPEDTFAIRLAVVRAFMGWNYDQAARATGIGSETWRTWEKGARRCSDITGVAEQISSVTGLSVRWLVLGGPLAAPQPTGTKLAAVTRVNTRWSETPRNQVATRSLADAA